MLQDDFVFPILFIIEFVMLLGITECKRNHQFLRTILFQPILRSSSIISQHSQDYRNLRMI